MGTIIGVGDNTFDRYIDQGVMYPGGNSVNVPVFFKRLGGEASYLGWVGNDRRGELLLDALRDEGVDVSRCRIIDYPTGRCDVELRDGDRHFMGSIPGARKHINLEKRDYKYISSFDITHTSIYSYIEPYLEDLSSASKLLSFDFSSDWTREYLKETLPYIDAVFLSAPELSNQDLEKLLRWIYKQNNGLVVATRGEKGSLAYDGDQLHQHGVIDVEVIDTLGAGDSYIARILNETQKGIGLSEAMALAAQSAAETCGYYGAWGHGSPIEDA